MFKLMKKTWGKLKHSLRGSRRGAPSGMLQRSSSAALPHVFDRASPINQSGIYGRSMSMTSGSNIWIPTPAAVIASNGRQLQTSSNDMPIYRPPHTLQVGTDAGFSQKLQIWIVSMVATDDNNNVIYAKLRGYNNPLPPNQNSSVYSFDSELYGVYEAAKTVGNDMDLSPYLMIQFITDSKDVADNINDVNIDNRFMMFSGALVHNTRQELARLLEDRVVMVCWTRRKYNELADQFGRRVRIACERKRLQEQTVANFKEELMEGIVYDSQSITELIPYL